MVLRMLSKIPRPSSTAAASRGEIIVRHHHIGSFFRHIGSGHPHGHADVRRFDCGRVVHAIARHGHDGAARLPGFDDAQLVLRRDSRIHRHLVHGPDQFIVGESIEFHPRQRLYWSLHSSQFFCNRHGRILMISRNHHRPNAGILAGLNSGFRLRP